VIVFDEVIFEISDSYEPSGDCFVDERSFASPTEGVIVLNGASFYESSLKFQIIYDQFFSIFNVFAFII